LKVRILGSELFIIISVPSEYAGDKYSRFLILVEPAISYRRVHQV